MSNLIPYPQPYKPPIHHQRPPLLLHSKIYLLSRPSLTYPISLQTANAPPATFHPPPKKLIKGYLLWSVRVPCPGKGFHGVQQWLCGSCERVDTAYCGVGALKASGSYPAGQQQCSQVSSSAHHNLSSHTQSERVVEMREVRKCALHFNGK